MDRTIQIGPLKIPAIAVACAVSATFHGGLFTVLHFLEWTPVAVSKPHVDFAKGEPTTWVKVTLIPPPDPAKEQLPVEPHEAEPTENPPAEIPLLTKAVASPVLIDASPLEEDDGSTRTCEGLDPFPDENREVAARAMASSDQSSAPECDPVKPSPPPKSIEAVAPDVQPVEHHVKPLTKLKSDDRVDVPAPNPVTPPPIPEPAPSETNPPSPATAGVETGVAILDLPRPAYPIMSRRLGEEGVVLLQIEVRANGSVGTVKVLRDPGFRRLTAAAVAAAKKGRFKPARRDGRPVRSTVRIPFRFVLR